MLINAKIKALTLTETGLTEHHIISIADYLSQNKKIQNLYLQNNDIRMDGCLYLAKGIVLNKSLRILNLSGNKIGTKGLQLICESLKDNNKLQSLFLNNNLIDNDGAYIISSLLGNQRNQLKELHLESNKLSQLGLNIIFDTIALYNKKLRYLDIAYNIIEIGIMRSFRAMLEKNCTLQYLSISGLYKFNDHAISSLQDSLILNKGLKLIDLKKSTKEFYFAMQQGVNMFKGDKKIIFLKDDRFVVRREIDIDPYGLNKKKSKRSYTPQKALEQSSIQQLQVLPPKRRIGKKKQKKQQVEILDDDKININTQNNSHLRGISSHSMDDINLSQSSNYTFQNGSNKKQQRKEEVKEVQKEFIPVRSSHKLSQQFYATTQPIEKQRGHFSSIDEKSSTSKSPSKRVQFSKDIKIFKEAKNRSNKKKSMGSTLSPGQSISDKQNISIHSNNSAKKKGILKQQKQAKIFSGQQDIRKNLSSSYKSLTSASPSQFQSIDSFAAQQKQRKGVQNKNNTSIYSSQMDESTSFMLSPEEKENLKYNMKDDKVVVFYKKILGEIRDVIREERSNIQKYLK